jgi:DNA-binding transcriptional LysR family regulator
MKQREAAMKLDARQLRNLCAVVERGTFMRASAALNISQPALSKSIRLLEHAVGVKLLDRGRHGAKATPFGEALVLRYKRIATELREAFYDIEALKGLSQGHLAIGATLTVASYLVPGAVSALKARSPNIAVEIVEDRATNLLDALKDARLDAIVGPIYGDVIGPELAEEFLFHSHLVVVTRPGHPLSHRRNIALPDVAPYLYVGVGGDNTVARQVQALLKTAGLTGFRYAVETNSLQATKDIIRQSDYFGLLPECLVEVDSQTRLLHVMRLKAAGNAWPFGVRWRRDRSISPAMVAFIAELKKGSQRLARKQLAARRGRTACFA